MKLEPNALLAVSAGFALILAVMTAGLYGPPGAAIGYAVLALACACGFVLLAPAMARLTRQPPRPPMIHPGAPGTALWASLFPMMILALAAIPLFRAGHDHGLLVIIASVLFGVTAESAIKARKRS